MSHPSLKSPWSPSPPWQWSGKDQHWMEVVTLTATTWRRGRRKVYSGSRLVLRHLWWFVKADKLMCVCWTIKSLFCSGGEGHYQRHQTESHQPCREQWISVQSLCYQQGWSRKLLWSLWSLQSLRPYWYALNNYSTPLWHYPTRKSLIGFNDWKYLLM